MLRNPFIESTGPIGSCGHLALPPHLEGCVSIKMAMIGMT